MLAAEAKDFYSTKRVLVTGGAGFIGSHLVEKLVDLGAKVTVLDNFSTGKLNNLYKIMTNITLLYTDVCSNSSTFKATVNQDIVFHLAAFVSVPQSIQYPALCTKVNIDGTQNLLECCKRNKVPTFIFSSSSAVYGNRNGACTENDPVAPQSPYAESKLKGEALCKQYALEGLNCACLRYFNVYGERQNPNGFYAAVVAKFKHNLLNNEPITIFGDGHQTRDFVNVTEVVNANLQIAMQNNMQGEIFNIGSGKSQTLLELLSQLENELSLKPKEIKFEPARQGDVINSQANCSKYANLKFLSSKVV
jgi:nucleoside-diphosphate-sugar epimerase